VFERLHDRLVEFVTTLRETVPVNPFCDVTVMVDEPATLAVTVTTVGFDETVKSGGAVTW
jgi:hypothetical protein